jgi:hypothetical protein
MDGAGAGVKKYPSTIEIASAVSGSPGEIAGTLTSTKSSCLSDRKVRIVDASSPSATIVTTTTDGDGAWVASGTFAAGQSIFARASKEVLVKRKKICRGDDSPAFGVEAAQHSLTITSAHGVVSCDGGPCAASYPEGMNLTLTAVPESGYLFESWGGDCSGATCSLTMSADKAVTANYDQVIFSDPVDDTTATGYTIGSAGPNTWQRVNSSNDQRASIVWRGGSSTDGANYVRDCSVGTPQDRIVSLEKTIDLTGVSAAEVRFLVMDDVQSTASDQARLIAVDGVTPHVLLTWTGQSTTYSEAEADLTTFAGKVITLRWELVIRAGSSLSCPAGRTGFFLDDIKVTAR